MKAAFKRLRLWFSYAASFEGCAVLYYLAPGYKSLPVFDGLPFHLGGFFWILMSLHGLFWLSKGAAVKKGAWYFIILVLIYTSYNLINIFDVEHLAPFFRNMALCFWPAIISGLIVPSSERRLKSFLICLLTVLLLLFLINAASAIADFSTIYALGQLPFTAMPSGFYLVIARMLGLLQVLALVWYYRTAGKYNLLIIIFLFANIMLLGLSTARMSFLAAIFFMLMSIPLSRSLSGPERANKVTHLLLGLGFMFCLVLLFHDHLEIISKLGWISNAYNYNTRLRTNAVELSIWMFKEKPVFGYGFGGYAALDAYQPYPHNIILDLLCEQGLMGAGLFFILLIHPLWRILKTQGQAMNEYCFYMVAFTLYYLCCSFSSGDSLSARYLWLGLALLWGQGNGRETCGRLRSEGVRPAHGPIQH
jgi:O-antigen ligase